MAFNKVILSGNLVANPELKQTASGTAVVNFRIAVGRRFKKEGQPEADFFTVTAWGGTAEFISKYFTKGKGILICGRMQSRTWTDDGNNKHYEVEVVADEVYFMGGKTDSQSGPDNQQTSAPGIPTSVNTSTANFVDLPNDEDLPF
jgi:single-strand DNA-binding protein